MKFIDMANNIVKVQQGLLRGGIFKDIDGNEYISFTGVPYAEPPVDKLRFKDPYPLQPWAGTRDATKESNIAPQLSIKTKIYVGSEDCLYLNIVTRDLSAKKPVLVWIHGGAFASSSSNFELHSPDYLVSKDIVYVGVNYRLGILGFLNMNHEDCPGNQGLKDQVMALKWIQQNIKAFGGDPKNVTLMGGSAGSACVHYLCLTPLTKGLFHKAILQSGVVTNPWAFKRENREFGYELAQELGVDCADDEEVLDYLKIESAQKMTNAWDKLYPDFMYYFEFKFSPTIDSKSATPIITDEPSVLTARGIDVPILMGYNSDEGIICFVKDRPKIIKAFNDRFEKTLISELNMTDTLEVSRKAVDIRKMYFGNDVISMNNMNSVIRLFSDVQFINGIQQIAEIQRNTKNHPIYLYKFCFSPSHTLTKFHRAKYPGIAHVDEMSCLFYSSVLSGGRKFQKGSPDAIMAERLSTMWTNFAKTGDPNLKNDGLDKAWLPMTKDRKNYLELGETMVPGINPDEEAWKIWRSIYLN